MSLYEQPDPRPSISEQVGLFIYRCISFFSFGSSKDVADSCSVEEIPSHSHPHSHPQPQTGRSWKDALHIMGNLLDIVLEPIYRFTRSLLSRIIHNINERIRWVWEKIASLVLDATETIYLTVFSSYRARARAVLDRTSKFSSQGHLIIGVIVLCFFASRSIFLFSPRHIVVFALIPVCLLLLVIKPIYGMMFYLVSSLCVLSSVIWNFPKSFMGVPLYTGTPVLLATIFSWVIERINQRKRFNIIYDSNNYIILLFWSFLTLSCFSTVPYGTDKETFVRAVATWDYLVLATWFVLIFFMVHLIEDDKEKFMNIFYTLASVYAYYAYKTVRMASYYGFQTVHKVSAEIPGRLADDNELCACLNMALPLFYALFLYEKKQSRKTFWIITFIVTIVAIIYTQSRGGYIGLAFLSIPLFYKLMLSQTKNKVAPLVFIYVIGILGSGLFYDKIANRVQSISNWETDGAATSRLISYAATIEMMKDSPLLGIGFGNQYRFREFCLPEVVVPTGFGEDDYIVLAGDPGRWMEIHDAYLALGGHAGLLTLSCFIGLLVWSMLKMRRLRNRLPRNEDTRWIFIMSHAIELCIYSYMITALFLNNTFEPFIYILCGLSMSLEHIAFKDERTTSPGAVLLLFALLGFWLYLTVGARV